MHVLQLADLLIKAKLFINASKIFETIADICRDYKNIIKTEYWNLECRHVYLYQSTMCMFLHNDLEAFHLMKVKFFITENENSTLCSHGNILIILIFDRLLLHKSHSLISTLMIYK